MLASTIPYMIACCGFCLLQIFTKACPLIFCWRTFVNPCYPALMNLLPNKVWLTWSLFIWRDLSNGSTLLSCQEKLINFKEQGEPGEGWSTWTCVTWFFICIHMMYLLSLIRVHFVLPTQIQPLNIRHGKDSEEGGGWYATLSFDFIVSNAHNLVWCLKYCFSLNCCVP